MNSLKFILLQNIIIQTIYVVKIKVEVRKKALNFLFKLKRTNSE